MGTQCCHCGIDEEERDLRRCVICYKNYCDECGWDRGGRWFCTKACSDFFFFGDED